MCEAVKALHQHQHRRRSAVQPPILAIHATHGLGHINHEPQALGLLLLASSVGVLTSPLEDIALARALTVDKKVKSYAIFIADKESSEDLMSALPIGHGFAVNNTKMLPKIFKDIFTSSLIAKL